MNTVSHWINGSIDNQKSDRLGEIFNPATGEISGNVAFADALTVDKVVKIAEAAFTQWRHSSLTKRTQILFAVS